MYTVHVAGPLLSTTAPCLHVREMSLSHAAVTGLGEVQTRQIAVSLTSCRSPKGSQSFP